VYDDSQILKDTKTGESVMRGRKSLVSIQLTDEEQRELEAILRRTTVSAGLVRRAWIILLLAKGLSMTATARQVEDQRRVVLKWGRRFEQQRLSGLFDAPRPGRPPIFSPDGGSPCGQNRLRMTPYSGALAIPMGLPGDCSSINP
jgi:hypothetical protein